MPVLSNAKHERLAQEQSVAYALGLLCGDATAITKALAGDLSLKDRTRLSENLRSIKAVVSAMGLKLVVCDGIVLPVVVEQDS